jgi:hypothetical protein
MLNKLFLKGRAAIVLPVPGTQEPGVAVQGAGSTALAVASAIPAGGRSGGGRPGGVVGDRVSPQLEQVVGAAQQLPLRGAGGQPAAHESAGVLAFLDGSSQLRV